MGDSTPADEPKGDFAWPRPLKVRHRTGVVGLASSGKSTFLVSVIDRIWRLDDTDERKLGFFHFTRHVQQLSPFEDEGGFPYRQYRDYYRTQQWPDKTVATSEYRCKFYRTGRHFPGRLAAGMYSEEHTLADIPGERLADFSMAGKSYAEWSDWLLDRLQGNKQYRVFAEEYLRLLEQSTLDELALLNAYKLALANFTRKMLPLVCPSTFLVHEKQLYPKGGDEPAHMLPVERLASRGVCGLDETTPFFPLSPAARSANPQLAETFAERYDDYYKAITKPLARGFENCDELLVLVDVCAILAGGPDAYYGARWSLQMMLEALDPGCTNTDLLTGFAKALFTGLRLGPSRVRKIGFVATKADVVHSRDRANLRALLKSMTQDLLAAATLRRHLDVDYFYCAAIEAGIDGGEYPRIRGWARRSADLEYLEFPNSAVPRQWPAETQWEEQRYRFAAPEPPKLDLLGRKPFPSIGMDEIMKFIGWDAANED